MTGRRFASYEFQSDLELEVPPPTVDLIERLELGAGGDWCTWIVRGEPLEDVAKTMWGVWADTGKGYRVRMNVVRCVSWWSSDAGRCNLISAEL